MRFDTKVLRLNNFTSIHDKYTGKYASFVCSRGTGLHGVVGLYHDGKKAGRRGKGFQSACKQVHTACKRFAKKAKVPVRGAIIMFSDKSPYTFHLLKPDESKDKK